MQSMLRISSLLLTFVFVACGGSTPPPNDATNDKKESAPGGPEKNAALDEEHKGFMSECMESPDYEAYCSCSWDTIIKSTTAEDRKDIENPNTKKALASARGECFGKIPKSAFKESFVKTCAKKPEMGAFCECSYNFLDGKGLLTSSTEELEKVQPEMRSACSKEFAEITKAAFIEGCSEKVPAATCQCLFGSLEKKFGKDKLRVLLETNSDEIAPAIKAAKSSCPAK